MPFAMQPVQFQTGGWMVGEEKRVNTDQTFPRGTPVTWAAADDGLDEHAGGATVTGILGVSLEGATSGAPADNPSGMVNYAHAGRGNIFAAVLTNGSGVVQVPDSANILEDYGILKNGTGRDQWWSVDEADTTDVVVHIIGIDTERNLVFFRFLESAIQHI